MHDDVKPEFFKVFDILAVHCHQTDGAVLRGGDMGSAVLLDSALSHDRSLTADYRMTSVTICDKCDHNSPLIIDFFSMRQAHLGAPDLLEAK